jgi:hypothetical protein
MRSKKAKGRRACFPIRTEITVFDGWKYEVVQVRPAGDPLAFESWRTGIFERHDTPPQMLGRIYHATFEDAKRACDATLQHARKLAALW